MKLAIVLHQYLKKGPPEAMKEQKNKTIPCKIPNINSCLDNY